MKRLLFALFACAISLAINAGGRHHRDYAEPEYFVGQHGVFFNGRPVEKASSSSFKVLDDGYAKDNWNVYYMGSLVEDAACGSFTVLGWGYAKDSSSRPSIGLYWAINF